MRACVTRVTRPSVSFSKYRCSAVSAVGVVHSQSTKTSQKLKKAPHKHSHSAIRELVQRRVTQFLSPDSDTSKTTRGGSALERLVRAQHESLLHGLETTKTSETKTSSSADLPNDFDREENLHQTIPSARETLDVLFKSRLLLLQAKQGYRCNVDSLVLAAHVSRSFETGTHTTKFPRDGTGTKTRTENVSVTIADLGAGSGVVGILVSLSVWAISVKKIREVLFLEKQVSLASRCERNVTLNGLRDKATVVHCDVLEVFQDEKNTFKKESQKRIQKFRGSCDAVLINPPYYELNSVRGLGTLPTSTERLHAHYESTATLFEFAAAAKALLREEGKAKVTSDSENGNVDTSRRPTAHFIYPHDREEVIVDACHRAGLGDVFITHVFTDSQALANNTPALALIDAREVRFSEKEEENKKESVLFSDSPLVLYADAAHLTYCAEIETFMENLGLE